jgi:uncharacterized membrane protein HdeD (DUF308 family)
MIVQPKWRWWAVALRGVAAVLFGILALLAPSAAFVFLVLLFGAYALVDGVLALYVASQRTTQPRGAIVARGIVSIAAGIITLAWPGISALALLIVIGAWAIAAGALEIATAIRMRKELEHEWLLGTEGVLSILFGVALLISPLAGAIVLGLWVGAYALVLGVMLLTTAFQMRSYVRHHPASAAA